MPTLMEGLLRRLRQHSNDSRKLTQAEKSGNICDTPRVVATNTGQMREYAPVRPFSAEIGLLAVEVR